MEKQLNAANEEVLVPVESLCPRTGVDCSGSIQTYTGERIAYMDIRYNSMNEHAFKIAMHV
jgi:hypothetical protein